MDRAGKILFVATAAVNILAALFNFAVCYLGQPQLVATLHGFAGTMHTAAAVGFIGAALI